MLGLLSTLLCTAAMAPLPTSGPFADTDHDGLIDLWETVGIGPLDPALLGCKPNHTDVIIVFRIRSNMTQATIQPTIDRLKKYYAGLPNKNPDGTTGVNMIAIVPPPMPKETDNMGYIQLYDQAMPKEWRGLAHGILVDNSGGGGGQSNRPDWCGCGYNWHTMAHELGHQFGLPHEPMGARTGSPFHPSMMNYDYSYQLNGNGEAITYSTGKFKKMEMKESDLNEVVQFPIGDLEFLSKRPYFFKLKKLTETTTAIDWNRNGIFGENHVRADVNDGYSAAYRDEIRIGKTAGAPALASMGKSLAVIFPDFQKPEGYDKFDKSGLTVEKPGNLKVRVITDHKAGSIQRLADDVTGDPSTIFMNRKLWLGFPMAKGYGIKSFTVKEGEFEEQTFDRLGSAGMIPTLVASPEAPFLLTWNPTTHLTTISAVDGDDARPLEGMDSTNPVGGVWNTKRNCLSLAATVLQDKKANRIRIFNYKQDAAMAWKLLDTIWIEGVSGNAAAGSRCQIVFDDTKDRGPNGGYNVYLKGNYPDPNQAGLNYLCRQIEDKTLSDGWRVKMMGNEWAFTRSVCSVTPHEGDIAYAMRWTDESLAVYMKASGIEDSVLTDFDEVSFICNTGFANSLRWVQNEQWPKLKGKR